MISAFRIIEREAIRMSSTKAAAEAYAISFVRGMVAGLERVHAKDEEE